MTQERIPEQHYEDPQNQAIGADMPAAGLDGHATSQNYDRSLSRDLSGYDENSGPGMASGVADDPMLGGSSGAALYLPAQRSATFLAAAALMLSSLRP